MGKSRGKSNRGKASPQRAESPVGQDRQAPQPGDPPGEASGPLNPWLSGIWSWRTALVLTGIILVLLAVIFPGAVLRGEVFISGDAQNSDSFTAVGDASLAEGHYPLWNPYLFAGMPTFGSMAYTKFLYPPTAVFNFMQQQLLFPPQTWMLAHLLVGGLGMAYLLSRWKLPLGALCLGALVWIAFPKVVAWGVLGHGSKLGAAMYLPWIIACGWRILDGHGARAIALTGLLLGLQFLRSHPQITYYTMLLLGWLAVANTIWPLSEAARAVSTAVRWRRLAMLGIAIVLGFALGAIMLLPVHDYADISIRGQDKAGGGGVGFDYATGWSLAPAELGTIVLPSVAGFGKASYLGLMPFNDYPNYLGFLLLSCCLVAWWSGQRKLVTVLAVMSLLVLLTAFGRHTPFYKLLYDLLPFFNKFRIPSMILILFGFGVAVMAALGTTRIVNAQTGEKMLRVLPVSLAAGGVLLLLGGTTGLVESGFLNALSTLAEKGGKQPHPELLSTAWQLHRTDLVRIGLILLTSGAAIWYSGRQALFRRRGLIWVIVILVLVDLNGANRRIVFPERSLSQVVVDPGGQARLGRAGSASRPYVRNRGAMPADPVIPTLREQVGHDRVWPLGQLGLQNRYLEARIHSLGGYHPAKLAAFEQIRQRLNAERPAGHIASWLAGAVVALEQPLSENVFPVTAQLGFELNPQPLFEGRTFLYRNRSALPRARLVSRFQLEDTLPQRAELGPFLDDIQQGRVRFAEQVVLDRLPNPQPVVTDGQLPAPVFVSDGLDEIVIRTSAPQPAILVLADMNTPGWQVLIDDQPADLLKADLVLRAVALPAGEHEVRFLYHDPSVRAGLTISLSALAVVLVLFLAPLLFRKRRATAMGEIPDE